MHELDKATAPKLNIGDDGDNQSSDSEFDMEITENVSDSQKDNDFKINGILFNHNQNFNLLYSFFMPR